MPVTLMWCSFLRPDCCDGPPRSVVNERMNRRTAAQRTNRGPRSVALLPCFLLLVERREAYIARSKASMPLLNSNIPLIQTYNHTSDP